MKSNIKTRTQSTGNSTAIGVSIVEDDLPAREILAGWVKDATGFEFISGFGRSEEGLLQLPQQKPDVVLMDIKLPSLSGV